LTNPDIQAAAQALKAGDLLGLPTETVYGLAANADDAQAVALIFAAKGRPSDHPLIVHVAYANFEAALAHYASEVPPVAHQLMRAFWPGPLTLIVPRRAGVAQAAAGGQDSIGLRCPAHPLAQAVLEAAWALGVRGVAAPSANRFGRVSPTSVAHVREELGPDLRVIDGGPCAVGIESTLIDCTRGQPVLLRPGSISRADIQAACGVPVLDAQQAAEVASLSQAPRASGTLASHYAPVARVHLLPWDALQKVVRGLPTPNVAVYSRSALVVAESEVSRLVSGSGSGSGSGALPGVVCCPMPESPQAAAHELFAVLRELDAMGVSDIYVQTPPSNPEWDGVRDRLTRASA